MPVSIYGQVPRDQREQELEYFLSKQYNSIGLRIQNKILALDQQQQQSNSNKLTSGSFLSNSSASFQQQQSTNSFAQK